MHLKALRENFEFSPWSVFLQKCTVMLSSQVAFSRQQDWHKNTVLTFCNFYPPVNIHIAIQHGPVEIVDFPIYKIVIFHRYVKLLEGNLILHLVGGFKHEFSFPFHLWDVILPIDSYFSEG